MVSIAAEKMAEKVLETIGKKKIPNLGKIAKEVGYSDAVAKNPQQITRSKSYQKKVKPYTERLIKFREKILTELEKKDLSSVAFKELQEALSKNTHDIQLLTGGSTENIFQVMWQKNEND